MNVMRSNGQPELIYVLLTDADAEELRNALPKKHPLRKALKKVLR